MTGIDSTLAASESAVGVGWSRQRQSTVIVLSVFLITGGGLMLLSRSDIALVVLPSVATDMDGEFYDRFVTSLSIVGSVFVLLGLAQLLQFYLRYGFKLSEKESLMLAQVEVSASVLERLQQRMQNLEINADRQQGNIVAEQDRLRLLGILERKLEEESSAKVFADLERKFAAQSSKHSQIEGLRRQCDATKGRLLAEVEALSRRGNVNLVIGSTTAIAGLLILGLALLPSGMRVGVGESGAAVEESWARLATEFLPRLSFVLLIELFAYFFLRLYKASLDGIKYFQNELTNAEAKFLGLEGALILGNEDSLRAAIESLSKTERNFVLQKDQTTVDLEAARLDSSMMKELLASITGVVGVGGKKSKLDR